MKSIQSSCQGWAETIAAYRLLNSEHLQKADILASHRKALIDRAIQHDCVVVAQDTTELDYTRKKSLRGSGPLSNGRSGFQAHSELVLSSEGLPLGVLGTEIFARGDEQSGDSRKQKSIEEKESYRWLRGYLDCCELAEELPGTEVLSISDREGDIYDIYHCWQKRCREGKITAQWLVRANQDRALLGENGKPLYHQEDGDEQIVKLFEQTRRGRNLGTHQFRIKAARQKQRAHGTTKITQREARQVHQRIMTCEVIPRPPYRRGGKLAPTKITAVLAEEIDPPADQKPISWLLLTSRRVESHEEALELINLYRTRWEIEVFHRVLKTGCRVEELQLRDSAAVIHTVVLYMIVAWRILYLMHLGRECPDLPCGVVFEEAEWRSVLAVEQAASCGNQRESSNVRDPGSQEISEPTLGAMILLVARQGGYLGRKNDGPPGAQVMWQGMEKVRIFAIAWQAFGNPGH